MPSPCSVFVPAYAKINWTLDVLGKRDDGFHELKSVMQTIALHDTLRLTLDASETSGTVRFSCDVPELRTADNLAVRAVDALRRHVGRELPAVRIELSKRIPTQAGLGGGSSDAAAVLVALNALCKLGLDVPALEHLGAEIGSDVPFFIRGGTALIEGRGEHVTPLPDGEQVWLVVVKPAIGLATPTVFRALRPEDFGRGEWSDAVADAIRAGAPLPFERLHNDLESGVLRTTPAVANAQEALREAGARYVLMSGSGAALFAPFRDLEDAARVFHSVAATGLAAWLTHTIAASAAHGDVAAM